MRSETALSDQSQVKARLFIVDSSLVYNCDKTIVTILCCNKVLAVCNGVWDVGYYVSCLDVENSAILADHE